MKVKMVEIKLGENRQGHVGHVLNWEPTEGDENGGPQFGVPIEKAQNGPREKQENGSEKAAGFEGDQHEIREEGIVAQKRTV